MNNFNQLSYTSNIIPFRRKSQQKQLINPIPIDKRFFKDPILYINEELSPIQKEILNYFLVCLYNFDGDLYMSQETMAKKYDYCRKQINQLLPILRNLGFIDYIYRHMKTCLYRVSDIFTNLEIRKKLAIIFPVLALGPLSSIIATREDLQKKVTQINIIYKEFNIDHENRHDIFYFNNFHKLNSEEKRGDLDLKAFSDTLDNVFIQSHNLKTPDYIESLAPILELTDYGKAYLSCFSFEAISFAVRRILVKQELTGNPWNYFNKLLTIYCQEHNVEANWDNLPEVPRPITGDLRSIDKTALKKWMASSSSFLKKGKEKQAFNKSQAYCCGSCELNKTHPVYGSGRPANRTCNIERKKNAGQPGYNNAGELFSEAKKNLYSDWSTLEGVKRFGQTVKLLGYPTAKLIINSMLDPVDWLPEEEPKDLVSYIYAKASSPF